MPGNEYWTRNDTKENGQNQTKNNTKQRVGLASLKYLFAGPSLCLCFPFSEWSSVGRRSPAESIFSFLETKGIPRAHNRVINTNFLYVHHPSSPLRQRHSVMAINKSSNYQSTN